MPSPLPIAMTDQRDKELKKIYQYMALYIKYTAKAMSQFKLSMICVLWLWATSTSVCVSDHKDNKPDQDYRE